MADIGVRVNQAAFNVFRGERGLPAAIGALTAAPDSAPLLFQAAQISVLNAAPELAESAGPIRYPLVHLYCERVTNDLREKFRRFSGRVKLTAEARVSQARLEGIERTSQLLADAITEVLDAARGDWGNGMFYGGGYEIVYGPVKQGGKNFVQITKIAFEVHASAD